MPEAARRLGIAERTLYAWRDGFRTPQAAELYRQRAGNLADVFEATAWECIAVARDKVEEAPFNHLMQGAAHATDKALLLRGKPTQINRNANVNLSVTDFLGKLTGEQLEQLENLVGAIGVGTNPGGVGNPNEAGGAGAQEPA